MTGSVAYSNSAVSGPLPVDTAPPLTGSDRTLIRQVNRVLARTSPRTVSSDSLPGHRPAWKSGPASSKGWITGLNPNGNNARPSWRWGFLPKAAAPQGGEPGSRSAVGSSKCIVRADHHRHQHQLHNTGYVRVKGEPFEREIDGRNTHARPPSCRRFRSAN